MNKAQFQRLVDTVLRRNPELIEGPQDVDDFYTTLDEGLFGFNFYSEPAGSDNIYVEGDFPVPVSHTDEAIKLLERAGYAITDVHHHEQDDEKDIHFITKTNPSNASNAVSKALATYQHIKNQMSAKYPTMRKMYENG